MGDFSNSNYITSIKEIVSHIDLGQTTIQLNNNFIKKAKLELLPDNVINVYMDYCLIDIISWNDRNWGIISLKNNNFDTEEFDGFECDKLILDNNDIKTITFVNCKINNLSISNNKIKNINFFDCYIEVLDLSENHITNIITLPTGLKKLTLSSNKIQNFSIELSYGLDYLDISNNKLIQIPNIPSTLKYLDLSKNKIKIFDSIMIPLTLDYFDITENKISNCNEIFNNLKDNIKEIFYDSDDENCNDINISDEISETSETSEISELEEIKLNFVNSYTNNYREIKINDDDDNEKDDGKDDNENNGDNESNSDNIFNDEEIENAINEYKNGLEKEEQQEKEQIPQLSENFNFEKFTDISNTQNIQNVIGNLNDREMVLKSALERFRNGDNSIHNISNQVIEKIYLPFIPVELKWNINLN